MCGIAGIFELKGAPADLGAVERMTRAMAHRGPDAERSWSEGPVALGHRRLAIIDLSAAAHQPFSDSTGRYIMVYNGEMFNYPEVKAMLPDYPFLTTSDTEVLIAAFAKWGPDCIRYFKGMFAFAVWDRQEQSLCLVRDRLGVKPLYYYNDGQRLVFASEIRSILATGLVPRRLNQLALAEYFSYQSIGQQLSPIEGIEQLEAGYWMKVSAAGTHQKQYWDITRPDSRASYNDPAAVRRRIGELLSHSVERRLVSDVPVGAFLSGGIDSSAVVGLMASVSAARPNTFTVSFSEAAFDESPYAEMLAKKFNTRHTRIQLEPRILLDELENALTAMDSPSADGINTYVVSQAIRQAGITVALSGIGGDELFAGYPFFRQFLQLQKFKSLYPGTRGLRKGLAALAFGGANTRRARIRQVLSAPAPDIEYMYPVSRQILAPEAVRKFTFLDSFRMEDSALFAGLKNRRQALHGFPPLSQVSIADYLGYTQHTLLKDTDQMSMAHSLEVREPFFDHELVEYVLGIPDAIKFPRYPKSLLVESLPGLLPDEIVHRKKQGFLFPWETWLKNELRAFCELRLQALAKRPFINGAALMQLWKQFLSGQAGIRWPEPWMFVVLEYWLEKNQIDC